MSDNHDAAWHEERRKGIGGSDAMKVMSGDWLPLWRLKTGRDEPEDLSDVLQVQIGVATEDLNRRWFQKQTGLIVNTENCEHLVHPKHDWLRANLDGRIPVTLSPADAILECKHVNAFSKGDEIVERYYPQVQHYLAVVGSPFCCLSIFYGNHKWEYFEVAVDTDYQTEMLDKEAEFWGYVTRDEEPPNVEAVKVDIAFDDMRTVDLTGSNEWASNGADWLENKNAAKKFDGAAKGLKEMVEDDVKLATGHGVKVARAVNGSLRIGAMK